MFHLVSPLFLFIILFPPAVYAQETPRNERTPDGTLINQDYFTANLYPDVERTLQLVETWHLNERVWADFRDGRLFATLGDAKYVLDKFPNHPTGLRLLSAIAISTGDLSLPIPYYEKALRLYPQYASTHVQYGMYLVNIGLLDAGIARLKKAIEMDPKLALAYAGLASAYYQKGNQELARQNAERARQLGYRGKITGHGPEERPQ